LEQAELQTREALQEEVKQEEQAWLEQLDRQTEEEAKRHEMRVEACCLEERSRLAARDEACTEAWLVYAWAEAEARVNEEAAAIREEAAMREEQAARDALCTEAERQEASRQQASQSMIAQEAAYMQGLAAADAAQEDETQREIQLLLEERRLCEQELSEFRELHQATWPSQLAACKAKTEEAVTQQFQEVLLQSAAREDAYRERLLAAEVSREEANMSAQHLSARSDQMRQEYKMRVDDLLATTAHLEQEKILLSEERRRMLLGQHSAAVRSPSRPLSPGALITSPLSVAMPPGSPGLLAASSGYINETAKRQPQALHDGSRRVDSERHGDSSFMLTSRNNVSGSLGTSLTPFTDVDGSSSLVWQQSRPEIGASSSSVSQARPVSPFLPGSGHVGSEDISNNPSVDVDDRPIPSVYLSAIAMVEHYGWQEVHDCGPEWTALHWAASEGRADVCARLLAATANPLLPDHAGRSPLDYARAAGDRTVFEMLARAAGRDPETSEDSPAGARSGFVKDSQPPFQPALAQRESVVEVHPTFSPAFMK